jgi:hypothetical protein
MTADASGTAERMLDVLGADGPHPDHVEALMLYGRFVGAWDGRVVVTRRDGSSREESCEVLFGWVLEGRAVQDVWIGPARRDRGDPARDTRRDMYGTTIRVYDPEHDVWHITWIEPGSQTCEHMTGSRQGPDIVQEHRDADGARWQWVFTDITADSFRWVARESRDDGATWQVRNEFFLRRRS